MRPLVSILIPAYNAERWIAETLQSALGQTWPRKEIIVVDDGSNDQTLSIAQQFASKTVSVVAQQHQGASAARNKAYSLCQGDYIQWLDADDLLAPDKIEKQMTVVMQSTSKRTLFSGAWGYFIYRLPKARFSPTPLWCDLDPIEWLTRKWEGNWFMQTATWLVTRELTDAAGPWDTRLLGDDDGEYFSRVISASSGVRFAPESRVYWRTTPSSRLSYIGLSDKKKDAQFLAMKLQIGYLRACEDSARVRAACVTYLQNWLPNFYPNRVDILHEARQLAESLGGQLHPPRISWKYAWIEKLFGFAAARHVQLYYNQGKSCALRAYDKALHSFEQHSRLPNR
jgi:glycosyltransferase involved in cell wall biosynthesis